MIFLLCGLAIDSGLLYLAKARMSRAVDGASLAAIGNFNQNPASAAGNRDDVALTMRNFAIANYGDLANATNISDPPGGTQSTYTTTSGQTANQYTYTYFGTAPAPTKDSNGNYRRYIQCILQTGAGGQIVSAQCNARCPVRTYFIAIAGSAFTDLKVSSSAVATRNPRLIMVVIDRSASMLQPGGGAFELPAAVTTFLNFFDTTSDYIGIVSFGSQARLEMPLTTNFLNAGTNDLYDTYQTDNNTSAIPGVDPEEYGNVENYTNGTGSPPPPRRLKFGGVTCADEGIRMAMEQLMENSGFSNPNVLKYLVVFTDGAWNTSRTLVAAPGYTNVVSNTGVNGALTGANGPLSNNAVVVTASEAEGDAAGQSTLNYGTNSLMVSPISSSGPILPWGSLPVPTFSPWISYSNAVTYTSQANFDAADHTNDVWQSADGINEPLGTHSVLVGTTTNVANNINNNYWLSIAPFQYPFTGTSTPTPIYTSSLNVWVPPGAVDYVYTNGVTTPVTTVVSDYTNPTLNTNITLVGNESNVLVVPGYIADGILYDVLDMAYPDGGTSNFPRYRNNNYNEIFMWPDDEAANNSTAAINSYTNSYSVERNLMFRNYVNLLTGYYVLRPDDPPAPSTDTNPFTGATNALNGNGPYYPSGAFYWPFDLVGLDWDPTYSLRDATVDEDLTDGGQARHGAYSINMLSTNAAPEYAGELFYVATGGTTVVSDTTSVTTQITAASQWQGGTSTYPFLNAFSAAGLMTNESSHFPTNNGGGIGGELWRPVTFNGSNNPVSLANVSLTDSQNKTGGYVSDGNGNIYRNAMAYSGRPTVYFDFSRSSWEPIPDNHDKNQLALPLGNWKAQEYAWHARAMGVTIYTVGYGQDVNSSECALLATVANSTNVIVPGPTTNARSFNPNQPIGQQFYATTPTDISNDFYQVGTAINASLTQ
jgi:Flp pilus assembly protein TadG